jgi:hypothetical protein
VGLKDPLFGFVEELQGTRPWGRVLDAGTGPASLRWIDSLRPSAWTAVTADRQMAASLDRLPRFSDRIVIGDWVDEGLLAGETFDVVLADYLLGAVEGFAPSFQDQLFGRLRRHVGGTLYAVGLEPWPEVGDEAVRRWKAVVDARDAAIRLVGDRTYREYPLDWVIRTLQRSGYRVTASRRFDILLSKASISRQVDVGRRKLPRMTDATLAAGMAHWLDHVEAEAWSVAPLRVGSDWVVAAEPTG